MSAFRRAVALGAEMIELDVHLTKDGEVVVAHDAFLKRSTGRDMNIADTLFADLPPLKPKVCKED